MTEAFYGSNTGAFLYMGASTASTLPAPGSDTFTQVPLVGTITPPPNVLSSGFFNVLNDAVRRVIGGKLGDRVVDGDLVIDWTATEHSNMYADSIIAGGRKRNWYIIYPDSGNRRLDFVAFVSKWTEESFNSSNDAKEHRASYTLAVNGAITVTP